MWVENGRWLHSDHRPWQKQAVFVCTNVATVELGFTKATRPQNIEISKKILK